MLQTHIPFIFVDLLINFQTGKLSWDSGIWEDILSHSKYKITIAIKQTISKKIVKKWLIKIWSINPWMIKDFFVKLI